MSTLIGVKGLHTWTPAEKRALVKTAQRIGTNPDYLAAGMQFESGLNEKAINSTSGASGLIQFMPDIAKNLGAGKTNAEAIANIRKMNKIQQLAYVEKYFKSKGKKLGSLRDVYAAIFWPAAVGKGDDFFIAAAGSPYYDQNSKFDTTNKGYINAKDIAKPVTDIWAKANLNPRIPATSTWPMVLTTAVGAGVGVVVGAPALAIATLGGIGAYIGSKF